jgi:hypothetical protein
MDLRMRKALKEAMWKRYRRAPKTMKTKILDELCAATGYHRQYAIAQLNHMEGDQDLENRRPDNRPLSERQETGHEEAAIWSNQAGNLAPSSDSYPLRVLGGDGSGASRVGHRLPQRGVCQRDLRLYPLQETPVPAPPLE